MLLKLCSRVCFIFFILTACTNNNGGSTNSATINGSKALTRDQISTVPLVNGQNQSFYVYVTNNGTTTLPNIEWSIEDNLNSQKLGILQTIKSTFDHLIHSDNQLSQITIKDTSECTNLSPNQSCRVLLEAGQSNINQLSVSSDDSKAGLSSSVGVIQANDYMVYNSGDLADALVITPVSEINYASGTGSTSFFIVNNSDKSIQLNTDAMKTSFPANVSLSLGVCPSLLASGGTCQLRLVVTNPSHSTDQELSIPIILLGEVVNSDNSKTTLPKQNGDTNIHATTKPRGIIQYPFSQNIKLDNNSADISSIGIISNSGSGTLTVNNLTTHSDMLQITNNDCTGKTLGQGDICKYTININKNKIKGSGSNLVSINYTDEANRKSKQVSSKISWTYIASRPKANPAISMELTSTNLTQANKTTTLVINNIGNVALSNIIMPTMIKGNSKVNIVNSVHNPCTNTLAVGDTCSYTVTYNPSAPSEVSSVIFSNMGASYLDETGNTINKGFSNNNSIGINLASTFAGVITSNTAIALNANNPTGSIEFTNTGNDKASISKVLFTSTSSSNFKINTNHCNGVTLEPNQSCTVVIGLNNTHNSGAGNGVLDVVYDNHNDTHQVISSNNNISWSAGSDMASMKVIFANNYLNTLIGLESSTTVTIVNNGQENLFNLTIPTLNPPFKYISGAKDGCAMDGSEFLPVRASCTLTLTYSPSIKQIAIGESLPSFIANYSVDGEIVSKLVTSPYQVVVNANSPAGDLNLNPTHIAQSIHWVNSAQTSSLTVTNVTDKTIRFEDFISSNNNVIPNGCSNVLSSSESCMLIIDSNYTRSSTNKIINSVVTLNYKSLDSIKTQVFNVIGSYVAMPVVTPNLVVNSNLFNRNVSQGVNDTASYVITLTNMSTATNNGDTTISIPYSSLVPSATNGVTYSVDTSSITNKPCVFSNANDNISLSGGDSCNYHLVIHSGDDDLSTYSQILSTSYLYNVYSQDSLTPTPTNAPAINNAFNFLVTKSAQLRMHIILGDEHKFVGVESGLTPNPSLELAIINDGTDAVHGAIRANLPSGITADFSGCNNLPMNRVCHAKLTLSTENVISGNLNNYTLIYGNNHGSATASLPDSVYSVIALNSPQLLMVSSVTNCVLGDGVSSTCFNNPDSYGGSASDMKLRLTFTNLSTTTNTTGIALADVEQALLNNMGYTLNSNTCSNGVAHNGGTCVIEYNMPALARNTAITPSIMLPNFNYNYTYTSAQNQSISAHGVSSLNIDINIVNPIISLAKITQTAPSDVISQIITLSNLYQADTPMVALKVQDVNGNSVSGITTSNVSCGSIVANGTTCLANIVIDKATPIEVGYKLIVTIFDSISDSILFKLEHGWSSIGNTGFSNGFASAISMAFDLSNNLPYVAYHDDNSKVSVMKYNGNSWNLVGSKGFSIDSAPSVSLAINPSNNIPYVAFQDGGHGKLTVMKYNGSEWEVVGSRNISRGAAYNVKLAFNPSDNSPYVAYQDGSHGGRATVIKYKAGSWSVVGSEAFSAGSIFTISLAFNPNDSTPYVAYSDNGHDSKTTVMRYNGNSWENVGNPGFSADSAYYQNLAFNPSDNSPYIAYKDYSKDGKTTVMRYNGNSWEPVGNAAISIGEAQYQSLAFNPSDNSPYVAYIDSEDNNKAYLSKYNGNTWEIVGQNSFSINNAYELNLVFNPSDNSPYIAYQDGVHNNNITVMRYK